jgi:hypothetical protein
MPDTRGKTMPDLSRFKSLRPLLACSLLVLAACSRGDQTDPVAGAALESNATQGHGDDIIYRGICDGSAALSLGNDTVLVAYDELNTLFAFDKSGGLPSARADLTELLDLGSSDEIDIEAATVANGRIWWLGSHGLDSGGNIAPNRRLLFATNIPSRDLGDLQLLAGPMDLTDILLQSAEVAQQLTAAARQRPPKEGGISIEGLATSAAGGLLLGFRSPLSAADGISGKALLVNITPHGDTFEVQRVQQLDLQDRGVRALSNDGNGYLIIAGRVASGGRFDLYRWRGDATPVEHILPLEELNAEGLVDLGSYWLVTSDDGKVQRASDEADDGRQRCDRIRKQHRLGEHHPGVFFRARMIPKSSLLHQQ